MAMSATIVVVMKVTRITHVPYAFPSLTVYAALDTKDTNAEYSRYYKLQ
jgi:hypothetical protein